MFQPEQISKLNELETLVLDFIIKSPDKGSKSNDSELGYSVARFYYNHCKNEYEAGFQWLV